MVKKTIKIPFEIILRNKKTKEEMKVGNLTIPIQINTSKKDLQKIMKDNLKMEVEGDKQNEH